MTLNNQTSTPLRILWSSNAAWAKTGYGNQTALFLPRLQAMGHKMAHLAFYGLEGGSLNMGDIPVYPKHRDGYGNDAMGMHARHFRADVIITLIDAWVLQPQGIPDSAAWAPYFPVDMVPIPPPVLRSVQHAHTPIAYSKFGRQMAWNANLDARYVPHGVDTKLLKPASKKEARAVLGWSNDAFVFGMVAANKGFPSRKCLDVHLKAFKHLKKKHSDAVFYMHTVASTDHGGINLPELAEALDVTRGVVYPDQYALALGGFPDSHMTTLYNAMDVLCSVSAGEGFGIPILEAQACGTPVIVGDWTSMSELCMGGWKVPKPGRKVSGYGWIENDSWTPLAANQYIPQVGDVLEAMEAAYLNGIARERKGREAREGALAYDADVVARNYWRPVLDEIAVRLGKAQEVSNAA